MRKTYDLCENCAAIKGNVIKHATQYIKNSGVKSLVIGLSGGVDSTVTCALAREVCDKLGVKLIGVSLPTNFNKMKEVTNAATVGEAFCDRFYEYRIEKIANDVLTSLSSIRAQDLEGFKIRRGNVAARVRMIYLYHIAHENNGLVLSTDNLTELMLGFWTLHGDVGDFGMIQSLWKTEVYGLTHHLFCKGTNQLRTLALHRSYEATPTDGLGVSNSDLDQIGAKSYAEVDKMLIGYLKGDRSNLNHPVIQRLIRSRFKRNNPRNLQREDIVHENSH